MWGVKKLKKSTQTKKYGCWRTISSKAPLCQYWKVWAQKIEEIDANEEICVLALERSGQGGSEIEEIDAFDEINDIVERAALPVPEGLGSKFQNEMKPIL